MYVICIKKHHSSKEMFQSWRVCCCHRNVRQAACYCLIAYSACYARRDYVMPDTAQLLNTETLIIHLLSHNEWVWFSWKPMAFLVFYRPWKLWRRSRRKTPSVRPLLPPICPSSTSCNVNTRWLRNMQRWPWGLIGTTQQVCSCAWKRYKIASS